jgi:hypothetical protein
MFEAAGNGAAIPSPEAGFAGREARMTFDRAEAVKEGVRGGTTGSPTQDV